MKKKLVKRFSAVAITAMGMAFMYSATASADGTRQAYDATLKCAVANGLAKLDERDAGHASGVAEYDTKTHRSFDLAYTLGAKIGLTDNQVLNDLNAAQNSELPRMMRDRSYYVDVVATCKAMGLM